MPFVGSEHVTAPPRLATCTVTMMLLPGATPLEGTVPVIEELPTVLRVRVATTLTRLAASATPGARMRIAANFATRPSQTADRMLAILFLLKSGGMGGLPPS